MPSIKFIPPFIAHRGASGFAPENTLAAFYKAKELGATWIEFDVMLSADHEVVVFHDETLDRTTDGKGRVADFPLSYLRTLDAGSWFDPRFCEERVLSFREVIGFLNQHSLAANVEIKACLGQEEIIVRKVLGEIEKYWSGGISAPLISSFSVPVLGLVREFSSEALLGLLVDDWFDGWESVCLGLDCVAVDVNYKILNLDRVRQIKEMGKFVLAYTVDDLRVAKKLFGWGVDGVFTNNLQVMLEGE